MGHGHSRSGAGAGLSGVGIADDALALNCSKRTQIRGLPFGEPGTGDLVATDDDLLVVLGGRVIATCDPADSSTTRLRRCMEVDFEFVARVNTGEHGETTIDVAPA
jgi:hypothetical protein